MSDPCHPALYQINTRVWLTERSHALDDSRSPSDFRRMESRELGMENSDPVNVLPPFAGSPFSVPDPAIRTAAQAMVSPSDCAIRRREGLAPN